MGALARVCYDENLVTRRNLSSPPIAAGDPQARRRSAGGARHEASERVRLRAAERVIEGWTLNASRGGLRLIVEDRVTVGAVFELSVGDAEPPVLRMSKVVWVQDEADGTICGLKFLDCDGPVPSPAGDPAETPEEP